MATNFWEALTSYVNANFASSLPGGWHANEASVNDTFPLAVYSEGSEDEESDSSGQSTHDGTVDITIYSPSKQASIELAKLFRDSLKDAPLVFTDGQLLFFRPKTRIAQLDPDKGPGGIDVFGSVVTFRYIFTRNI